MAIRNIPIERFRRKLICPDETKPQNRQMFGVAFPGVEFPSVSTAGRGTSFSFAGDNIDESSTRGNHLSPLCSMSLRQIAEIARVRESSMRPGETHSLQPKFEYFPISNTNSIFLKK